MKRGEIWWAEPGVPKGSDPGFRHPVVILQNDKFLESRLMTVTCILLTTNENLADSPGNIVLKKQETCLSRDSVVNVSQIVTLDKRFLLEKAGNVKREQLDRIEKGVLLALGIDLVRYLI